MDLQITKFRLLMPSGVWMLVAVKVASSISLKLNAFLSSANEVSTGPTCQFLFVCLSGLFFKASNWMIYWLLTVVLAPYLSN